mmetsp:Transcript_20444/g.33872  ORF Transcript_20444/g.33872 Transcript_20444/m.33872 type:complete len:208 (-) Transcript_20444:45-668(-)
MCSPLFFQILLRCYREFEESQLSPCCNAHTNCSDADKDHPSTDGPIKHVNVCNLQGSTEKVKQSTTPGKFEELAIITNSLPQRTGTNAGTFQGGNEDSKHAIVEGNHGRREAKGEEAVENRNTVGGNHGEATDKGHDTVCERTLTASLLDLFGRCIYEGGPPRGKGPHQGGVQEAGAFCGGYCFRHTADGFLSGEEEIKKGGGRGFN